MRKVRTLAAWLTGAGVGVAAAWIYANRRLFLVSDVTTGQSFDYPELRAHVYFADLTAAFRAAEESISSLPRWRLVHADNVENNLFAEVESQIGGLLSDVTVTLSTLGARHVRVVIRSKSRVGQGDLGENARNIGLLQGAMDDLLVGG